MYKKSVTKSYLLYIIIYIMVIELKRFQILSVYLKLYILQCVIVINTSIFHKYNKYTTIFKLHV